MSQEVGDEVIQELRKSRHKVVHQRTYTHWRTASPIAPCAGSTHRVTKDDSYNLVEDGLKLPPSLLSPKGRSFVSRQAKTKIKVHAQQ